MVCHGDDVLLAFREALRCNDHADGPVIATAMKTSDHDTTTAVLVMSIIIVLCLGTPAMDDCLDEVDGLLLFRPLQRMHRSNIQEEMALFHHHDYRCRQRRRNDDHGSRTGEERGGGLIQGWLASKLTQNRQMTDLHLANLAFFASQNPLVGFC